MIWGKKHQYSFFVPLNDYKISINRMPRFFVIRSRLCNKVLDIEAGNTNPGANVIIYDYNGGQNQLFYEDRSGVIRAKINNFAIDDSGEVNELF